MRFPDVVERIAPSVVALGSRLVPSRSAEAPLFPLILGTGFVVDPRGIVVTNAHAARLIEQLPSEARVALFFPPVQVVNGNAMQGVLVRGIRAFSFLESFQPRQPYYGQPEPDFAFLQVDARELPSVELNRTPGVIRSGVEVAVSGFRLGQLPLTVFGGQNQLSATVRKGIISSVHPCPGPYPDGFTMDIVMQGGNSGSPVFLMESGVVVGIVHAQMKDALNITLALPSNMLAVGLEACLVKGDLNLEKVPTWKSLLSELSESSFQWEHLPFNPTRIPG